MENTKEKATEEENFFAGLIENQKNDKNFYKVIILILMFIIMVTIWYHRSWWWRRWRRELYRKWRRYKQLWRKWRCTGGEGETIVANQERQKLELKRNRGLIWKYMNLHCHKLNITVHSAILTKKKLKCLNLEEKHIPWTLCRNSQIWWYKKD